MDFINSKLIINADDYGASCNINTAIAYCFQKKIINSTSIIVNMAGFENAIELAYKFNFTDKIGIHLNLTHGKPITNLAQTGLVDKNGLLLRKSISNPYIFFSKTIKNEIKNEIEQQYNKLLSFNIIPTHIDSHHHIHTIPWISKIFVDLAKKEKTKIRIASERFKKNIFLKKYNKLLNKRYKRKCLNFSDKFERVNTFIKHYDKLKDKELVYEIMVHPSFKNNILIDAVDHNNLEESLNSLRFRFNNP